MDAPNHFKLELTVEPATGIAHFYTSWLYKDNLFEMSEIGRQVHSLSLAAISARQNELPTKKITTKLVKMDLGIWSPFISGKSLRG